MSRDYKTRKPSKSTPEKGGSAFLGGFVGYALGLSLIHISEPTRPY